MNLVLAIAAGGALGAVGRHFVGAAALRLFGSGFPVGTVTVNIVGSFLMGALVALMAAKLTPSPELRAFLTVGLLGGFTTFSAFSLDAVLLYERGAYAAAAAYVAVSVVCSIGGLLAGLQIVRQVLV
ncbi:MAG: fluoride efflux transporter CrcB [Minwuiales bacterium]|nr:fluoride efflux transporter CrcB [Minwuiales bacterium]